MTLYPTTKCTPQRACDILEMVGTDRIMANSAGDWGKSDPLAVPELILEMRRRGHAESVIQKVVHDNPLAFFRQCSRWQPWAVEAPDSSFRARPQVPEENAKLGGKRKVLQPEFAAKAGL